MMTCRNCGAGAGALARCPNCDAPTQGRAVDLRGAHVTMMYQGRLLLGDVYAHDARTDRLLVRHFNGEPWPVHPIASAVDVLERR
jgi:hypothetical protein